MALFVQLCQFVTTRHQPRLLNWPKSGKFYTIKARETDGSVRVGISDPAMAVISMSPILTLSVVILFTGGVIANASHGKLFQVAEKCREGTSVTKGMTYLLLDVNSHEVAQHVIQTLRAKFSK